MPSSERFELYCAMLRPFEPYNAKLRISNLRLMTHTGQHIATECQA